MIGLFLGDTDFSEIVLKKVKKLINEYFIIDFSKNNKFKKEKNSYRISIGKFGEIIKLSDAYKEIFKNENLTENLNNLSKDFKKSDLVMEVVNFLDKDKKRPICTPFSK